MMNLARRALLLLLPLAGMLMAASPAKDTQTDDRTTEKTYSGRVDAVTLHQCEICKGMELSVFLKSGAGRLEVRLGPKAFFEEHDFAISRGDAITVTGLRYVERGKEIVLANEIHKGGDHLVLRGKNGRPAWIDVQGHICPICGN
jgi:hypothetical protein